MANETLILTLAKVLVAAAWADGEVQPEEINSLKDLLFHLPEITGREWAMLEMYIDLPIGEDERSRLIEQLQASLRTRKDKALALQALKGMIAADGEISEQEKKVAAEIQAAIEAADTGLFKQVGSALFAPLSQRVEQTSEAPNREAHFEDFIKNRVYFGLQLRLQNEGISLEIPDDKLRMLSLAGGLMARVALADSEVRDSERETLARILKEKWKIASTEADFVTEVALSEISLTMDYFRLTRRFFEMTGEQERIRFLDVLFAIAAADGMATNEEIEEIRNLTRALKLTHQDFINAKLKLPRNLRAS
jgi:uncharacterized tellurite resistance protein B-like protein